MHEFHCAIISTVLIFMFGYLGNHHKCVYQIQIRICESLYLEWAVAQGSPVSTLIYNFNQPHRTLSVPCDFLMKIFHHSPGGNYCAVVCSIYSAITEGRWNWHLVVKIDSSELYRTLEFFSLV